MKRFILQNIYCLKRLSLQEKKDFFCLCQCNVFTLSGVPVRVVPAHTAAEVRHARHAARRGPHARRGKATNKTI